MKKIIHYAAKNIQRQITILSLCLIAPLSVQAATLDDVVASINNVWSLIASSVSAATTTYANLIYEDNPSLPATVAGNTTQPTATKNANTQLGELALGQVKQALIQKDDLQTQLAVLPASDTFVKSSLIGRITGPSESSDVEAGDANLDFESLVSPVVYDKTTLSRADNFIKFAANLAEPLSAIKWTDLTDEQKESLDKSATGREFKVYLRSLVAGRSVAIDNLYYLFAERMPIKDLGTQAGLPEPDASAMQVKEYLANRRTKDSQWYTDMTQASPATIARETLFVLAEMEKQLHDLHKDNERLIASMSIMQLQFTPLNKFLQHEKEAEIGEQLGINVGSGGLIPESLQKELEKTREDIEKEIEKEVKKEDIPS